MPSASVAATSMANAQQGASAGEAAPARPQRWSGYCVLPPLEDDESVEDPLLEDDGLEPIEDEPEPDVDGLDPVDEAPAGLAVEDEPEPDVDGLDPVDEEPEDDGLAPIDDEPEPDVDGLDPVDEEPEDDGLAPIDDEPEPDEDGLDPADEEPEDDPAPMVDVCEDWPLEASLAFSTSTSACAWAALASFSHRFFCWPSLVSHCALADL